MATLLSGDGREGTWKAGNSGRIVAMATTGAKFLRNIVTVYQATGVGKCLPNLDCEKLPFVVIHNTPQMWMKALLGALGALLHPTQTLFAHCGLWLEGKEKQCSRPLAEKAN